MNMFHTNFISKHDSYYDDTSLLLQTNDKPNSCSALYFLSGDKFENKVKLDWPRPLQEDGRDFEICGSAIHGTFFLSNRMSRKKFALWNPATNEFRFIPCSHKSLPLPHAYATATSYGFGYDPIGDDFKVIQKRSYFTFISLARRVYEDARLVILVPCWEIYSLRSNSWRKVDMHVDYSIPGMGCDINGVCHWLAYDDEKYLVSFNLSSEVFFTTPLPLDMGDRTVEKSLLAINGSIAVISKYSKTTFHISILRELGMKESWTKLFIVGPLSGVTHPIGVGKKGIFFRKAEGEPALFNLSTQMLEEITFTEQLDSHRIVNYKESILPFGRTDY